MQVEGKCDSVEMSNLKCPNGDCLPKDLRNTLDQIAKKEGYTSYKITNKTISTDGGNYLGVLHEVDMKGIADGAEKETNMFVKCAIRMEHMTIVDITELYAKELFFYTELSEVFKELEDEASVPLGERFKSVKSYNPSDAKAIILQNIAKQGFTTVHRMHVMPLKFAELSVRELAKFHSLSFVVEIRRPKYFESKIKTLKQSTNFDEDFKKFFENMYRLAVKDLDGERRKRLDSKLPEISGKYPGYLTGCMDTVKCLCHGDYKMNNILMKSTDGEITETVPVDYQLIYYGSPITDLIYFLFSSTDGQFRREHLGRLKDVYHDTMRVYLKHYDTDVETVYPRRRLDEEFDECLDFSLYVTLFITPFSFVRKGAAPDFGKCDIRDVEIKLDRRYRSRLEQFVDDMIARGKL